MVQSLNVDTRGLCDVQQLFSADRHVIFPFLATPIHMYQAFTIVRYSESGNVA
jgi:hypothetical protein